LQNTRTELLSGKCPGGLSRFAHLEKDILTDQAVLALEDGSVFHGRSIGSSGESTGEVVFNTAMTGYQEVLSDPSYARQLVTLTYSHVGNTGCNPEDEESARPMVAGLIVRDCPDVHSNWRARESLPDYLRRNGIVAIDGIDTRRLTRILRQKGAQGGAILAGADINSDPAGDERAVKLARSFPGMQGMDLAREVTTKEIYQWSEGSWDLDKTAWKEVAPERHVVAYDFGVKHNILRMLTDRGCRITVVPATTSAEKVMSLQPDGVFLSNGPGDPEPCEYAIKAIRELIGRKVPLFGICLGHQLLGLAAGLKTVKMKFGHHGANHPVQELASGKVMITSQNHGFTVDESELPQNVRPTHRSLFDNSLQGIELINAPAFGFQGHPEASPGPHDISGLFDRFVDSMESARTTANVTVLREA
jgi:carbamoyl-phosphate synthase small subunit